jgi:hypothetical protein
MASRALLILFLLVSFGSVSHAAEERWVKFAQDADLSYFLDDKSVVSLPDNVYIFWIKSVAKEREYFKREYNVGNISYLLTNYELDCALSSYRVRGTIMLDKSRREISKTVPASPPAFEPVPPESVLELAQDEMCSKRQTPVKGAEKEEETAAPPAGSPAPAAVPPAAPSEPPSVE